MSRYLECLIYQLHRFNAHRMFNKKGVSKFNKYGYGTSVA